MELKEENVEKPNHPEGSLTLVRDGPRMHPLKGVLTDGTQMK